MNHVPGNTRHTGGTVTRSWVGIVNAGTIAKIGAAAGTTALVSGGLIIAHERVFLAAQPKQQRIDRTWLTAGEFSGAGILGAGAGAVFTHGPVRTAMLASGTALVASALGAATYATATARDGQADRPPFGEGLADLVVSLPPLQVRMGESLLAGGIVGGIVGGIRTRSVVGTLATSVLGGVLGAGAGAAVFSVIGADR